jgi:hypothetical protein
MVTDGHLPYPYGRETTGYEVADLQTTLSKAKASGVTVIVAPYTSDGRASAVVQGLVFDQGQSFNRHQRPVRAQVLGPPIGHEQSFRPQSVHRPPTAPETPSCRATPPGVWGNEAIGSGALAA